MNRIELYVDGDNRLTIDFFYNHTDQYSMTRLKGKECYSIISSLCEGPILSIKENQSLQEITLTYEGCTLNIGDTQKIFEKRGTGPIKLSLSKFYEEEKKKNFIPKKVTRKNKHVGSKIIASALVLAVLGGVIVHLQKNNPNLEQPEPTLITYETEISTEPTEIMIEINKPDLIEQPEVYQLGLSNDYEGPKKENEINVVISYGDSSNTEKAQITRAYYGAVLERYSKMYGVDPKIITAIATQEKGVHSHIKDPGGATGLMQIQNAVWIGKKITAFNYETNQYESFIVQEDMLGDVFYNIKIGCMYFQNCMDYMDNNIIAALQCYNMGCGSMDTILKHYSAVSGKSTKEILNDVSDCGWMDYRYIIKMGDPNYVENVLRWLGPNINVENLNINGNIVNLKISNTSNIKVK